MLAILLLLATGDPHASPHASAGRTPTFVASLARAHQPKWCLTCHGTAETGVGCKQCHVDKQRPRDSICVRCHEFNWPQDNSPAQTTFSEWTSSWAARAGKGCTSCHKVHGARPSAKVDVDIERGEIVVDDVGHRFPTGDPSRWLELVTCHDAECTQVVGRKRFKFLEPRAITRFEIETAPYWMLVLHLVEHDLDVPDALKTRVVARDGPQTNKSDR